MDIREDLKNKYNDQYSDKSEEWRRIGAIGKVENILDVTKDIRFETVVDIGAGDGNILSLLSEKGFSDNLTAVEISESAVEQIKKKSIPGLKEIKQFDGYNLPFEDNQFDMALCSHVIEHVEYPRKLLREIKRISKYQVIEVPIDFSFTVDKKFKHFNSYGHINVYTPALFRFLLLSEGFEIIKFKNALYKKEVIDYQIKKPSIIYLKTILKRFTWRMFPFLMRIKPNTFTVLTSKAD